MDLTNLRNNKNDPVFVVCVQGMILSHFFYECKTKMLRYLMLNAFLFVTKVKNHLLNWKSDVAKRRLYSYLTIWHLTATLVVVPHR
jgi:hypothetical protein